MLLRRRAHLPPRRSLALRRLPVLVRHAGPVLRRTNILRSSCLALHGRARLLERRTRLLPRRSYVLGARNGPLRRGTVLLPRRTVLPPRRSRLLRHRTASLRGRMFLRRARNHPPPPEDGFPPREGSLVRPKPPSISREALSPARDTFGPHDAGTRPLAEGPSCSRERRPSFTSRANGSLCWFNSSWRCCCCCCITC